MLNKELQKYIVYPKSNKPQKGKFFELALKNIIKNKKGKKNTLSLDVDKILYGKR